MSITREEFASSIKEKFPQYKDINDNELTELVLAKFPIYRGQVVDQIEQPIQKGIFGKVTDFLFGATKKFGTTLGIAASVIDPTTKKLREDSIGLVLFKL